MIDRFVTTLRALAALPAPALASPAGRALVADCADATRLELDCTQQDLTPVQRASLRRLSDALEAEPASARDIHDAVRDACRTLGIGTRRAATDPP